MAKSAQHKKVMLPRYDERRGWTGGDSRTLYAFTDRRTGVVAIHPGGGAGKKLSMHAGPEADVRLATRSEAEELWQSPLHIGWRVREGGSQHATIRSIGWSREPRAWKTGAKMISDDKRFAIMKSAGGGFNLVDLDTYNEYPAQTVQDAKIKAVYVRSYDRGDRHASKKKYPYIAYWVRSRGPGGQRDSVPIYVLGTTTRADEGIVGYDLRARPLRLGKGSYTMVVSPDDVEDKP